VGKEPTPTSITTLLGELNRGKPGAFPRVVEAVYDDLRRIAHERMRRGFADVRPLTMDGTALADEAVADLMRQRAEWKNSEHFFAIATRLMMRRLIDYQRLRLGQKRDPARRKPLGDRDVAAPTEGSPETGELAARALEAVEELHELDPRKAEVFTLRAICELSMARIAELVEVSLPTVERDWRFARAWIIDRMEVSDDP